MSKIDKAFFIGIPVLIAIRLFVGTWGVLDYVTMALFCLNVALYIYRRDAD